ncbi:uncharacterized protein LOC112343127 [Selaginella moellendorffii]|uniref:uncharacterized protein LOC112343127 n=1 Tax=Selaginella moellendorffii TaxID=88036 RepID=UPI000D1C5B1F|nr:uncharacterized protein LOC112343127 [Selaginella moellendorffii]|eukprot:XP_024521871.1 uncharacterized protein LOC112343127 [Selaginella moellendorffii]
MASSGIGIFLIILALATSASSIKCKTYTFQGQSLFTDTGINQNEFYVLPKDNAGRPGSMQTFAAPFLVSTKGYTRLCMDTYMGILANTGLGSFQSSHCSFADGSSLEFQDEAGSSTAGSQALFAIVGGTGRFEGATGTAKETSKGNNLYVVEFTAKVCKS